MRLVLLALLAVLATPALAQRPPPEVLEVQSVTASDTAFLRGEAASAPAVTLTGRLQLPGPGEKFPVIIMLHGSAGNNILGFDAWVRVFNDMGIASFRLDSYTGRGLTEIFSGQGRLGEFAVVYDAYRALEVLAAHPAIDPERIGVIGFSRGGIGALYTALSRFETAYGATDAELAVHLPFYPPCNFALRGELETTGAPIHAFHGSADAWNPAAPCRDYLGRLAAAGAAATFSEYPDAHHAFDNPSAPALFANPDAQTSRACFRREADGVLINDTTGAPFAWTDACVETGPPQQFQGAGADAATAAVRAVLMDVFGLE
jgi:dienelactone hydrolase